MSAEDGQVSTVADLCRGKPAEVGALCALVLATVQACGPVEVQIVARQIVLHGRRRIFASVRPTRQGLRGHLNLPYRVEDPRFSAVEVLTQHLFFHRFLLTTRAQVDATFVGWLRDASAVGQGSPVSHAPRSASGS